MNNKNFLEHDILAQQTTTDQQYETNAIWICMYVYMRIQYYFTKVARHWKSNEKKNEFFSLYLYVCVCVCVSFRNAKIIHLDRKIVMEMVFTSVFYLIFLYIFIFRFQVILESRWNVFFLFPFVCDFAWVLVKNFVCLYHKVIFMFIFVNFVRQVEILNFWNRQK